MLTANVGCVNPFALANLCRQEAAVALGGRRTLNPAGR
jgi:hypothetical protein